MEGGWNLRRLLVVTSSVTKLLIYQERCLSFQVGASFGLFSQYDSATALGREMEAAACCCLPLLRTIDLLTNRNCLCLTQREIAYPRCDRPDTLKIPLVCRHGISSRTATHKKTCGRGAGFLCVTFGGRPPAHAPLHLVEQPPLHSLRDRLAAIPNVELLEDVGDMILHRVSR